MGTQISIQVYLGNPGSKEQHPEMSQTLRLRSDVINRHQRSVVCQSGWFSLEIYAKVSTTADRHSSPGSSPVMP